MGDKSKIEWTDATWNPVVGCTKVSAGCKNCYAERQSARLANMGNANYQCVVELDHENERALPKFNNVVRCLPKKLDAPLRWGNPRTVFVNSMSDLFHKSVPFEFIDKVFAVMALCPQHTFQILTKRPERMAEYFVVHARPDSSTILEAAHAIDFNWPDPDALESLLWTRPWPLPNVHLGTSIENQEQVDIRVPHLLWCPAAVRFLSLEPLLGGINVHLCSNFSSKGHGPSWLLPIRTSGGGMTRTINWIVVGGESGPEARPMHPDWPRRIRDDCKAAGVPFFFKQQGEWSWDNTGSGRIAQVAPDGWWVEGHGPYGYGCDHPGVVQVWRVGKKAAGRLLDGVLHDEYP